MRVEFFVPGIPVPYARSGGGKTTARFTPAKQRAAMGVIKLFAQTAHKGPPVDEALALTVDAYWPWPSSWSAKKRAEGSWKTSRPDADNIAKLVKDSLNAVVWRDDALVVASRQTKRYGDTPGVRVVVETLA